MATEVEVWRCGGERLLDDGQCGRSRRRNRGCFGEDLGSIHREQREWRRGLCQGMLQGDSLSGPEAS
jgi:hypothetical protein